MTKFKLDADEAKVRRFINKKRSRQMEAKAKLILIKRKIPGEYDFTINVKEATHMVNTNNFSIEVEL
jgi:hypothetical protein